MWSCYEKRPKIQRSGRACSKVTWRCPTRYSNKRKLNWSLLTFVRASITASSQHFSHWRVSLRWDVFPDKLWENRTIPYVISPLYSESVVYLIKGDLWTQPCDFTRSNVADTVDYITIYKAISYINHMTCVDFVPWDEESRDFILIWPIKYPSG